MKVLPLSQSDLPSELVSILIFITTSSDQATGRSKTFKTTSLVDCRLAIVGYLYQTFLSKATAAI